MEPTDEAFGDSSRLVRVTNTANPPPDYLREMIEQRRATVLRDILEQEQLKHLVPSRPTRPASLLQRALEDFAKQPANRGLMESLEAWERERRACLDSIRSLPRQRVPEEQPRLAFDVREARVAGEGELWWAGTDVVGPDRLGITPFFDA
jgi:hypothetical protein